jgi:hypothetical protein
MPHMRLPRTIVIGDIHGCIDELRALLVKVDYIARDRVISLGDLLDRGPDPVGVVKFVREQKWAVVLGNHEEKAIRWAKHEKERLASGKKNPMRPFHGARLAEHAALTTDDLNWMKSLPAFARFEWIGSALRRNWIASHAGVAADMPIERQVVSKLCRTRYLDNDSGAYASTGDPDDLPAGAVPWQKRWRGPDSVIYGHIVYDEPLVEHQGRYISTVGIDTGCCFGGYLTAAVFEPGADLPVFVQVKAAKIYHQRRVVGATTSD